MYKFFIAISSFSRFINSNLSNCLFVGEGHCPSRKPIEIPSFFREGHCPSPTKGLTVKLEFAAKKGEATPLPYYYILL